MGKENYWMRMREKAECNIGNIAGWNKPCDEESVKKTMAHIIKHGTYANEYQL